VQTSGNEEGLLSVAFPPDYATKKHFYVYYTNNNGDLVIARYGLLNDNQADPNSEQLVLMISHPDFSNHNGGQLAFGPNDGYLYAGIGDGGSGGDPNNNGQNTAAFLGKILRLDVETGNPNSYTIPSTNPFTQTGIHRGEIWALGVRNPWRFSFDRQTGDLYIGDVGQNIYEEIDFQAAASGGGQNYGWKTMEGAHCFGSTTCDQTGLTLPVAEYTHSDGCSVTGGFVYRGQTFPELQGIYLYADYCSGKVWGLRFVGGNWQNTQLLSTTHSISTFGEDEAGNLYLTSYGTGEIYQVIVLTEKVYLPIVLK
jgi:glucose/arabinose dehydrogenase